jgi:RND family efflux transporter MFP subunit
MRQIGRISVPVLAALILLAGCAPEEEGGEVEFRIPVTARAVKTGTVEDRIVATGTLRAVEVVSLRAESAGALYIGRNDAGARLVEGDRVAADRVIAEIRGEDVRLAAGTEASYQRYKAAERDYESRKRLFDEGLISEQELRPLETSLAEAKLAWERSLLTENRSRLATPIAGVILHLARDDQNLPLADGQLVSAGQLIAQVAPIARLIADVDLVGPDISRVRPGMEARIRHHAWEDEIFEGKVIRLAPSLDPATRTLRAEVGVDNGGRNLRPGMFVEVTMIAERRHEVPVVPREAVADRGGRKVVFVVKAQKVEQRDVALGLGDDHVVEVRGGLEPEERIVVKGLETLTDGARIRVSGN